MTDTAQEEALSWHRKAQEHITQKRYDEASRALLSSLNAKRTAEAAHDFGILHYLSGRTAEAIAALQEATQLNPAHHQSFANLARILFETGKKEKAAEYSCLALKAGEDVLAYKEDFIMIIREMRFLAFYPALKEAITQCLKEENLRHQDLAEPWLGLLLSCPAFQVLQKAYAGKNYKKFIKSFDPAKSRVMLEDPYFIAGLRRLCLANAAFERFVTHLRRYMLENRGQSAKEGDLALVCALADYCFYTDYIMDVTAQEQAAIAALRDRRDFASLALLACYEPLWTVSPALEMAAQEQPAPFAELLRVQLKEPLEERAIRKEIQTATSINDEISRAVQAQYEDFPYPRWKTLGTGTVPTMVSASVPPKADMLIAGCGTGNEALEIATAFPQAKILAIDLSLASLSYAIRKARERGVENVVFRQGDILNLHELNQSFDLISSAGVLHHMEEPEKGWSVLTGLLRPGGFMRIALYSEAGRQDIVEARKIIAKKKYDNDRAGIRAFRRDCPRLLRGKIGRRVLTRRDFYRMAECRDLLFHVQEHRFTIPRIAEILERQKLKFIGFSHPRQEISRDYLRAFPDDTEGLNLRNWHEHEQNNPEIFETMYNFWCRK